MPNYYVVRSCLGFNDHPAGLVIESESPLSIGDVVSYDYNEQRYCGQIINDAEFPSNTTVASAFFLCCQCFTSVEGTNSNSFQFEKCGTLEKIYVDITTFCESTVLVPQLDNIYQLINLITGEIICATFISLSNDISETSWSYYNGPEISCETCQNKILNYPRSANTESFICEICCPCTTGSTITSVNPPHPVWIDGRGVSVTQLNMVVLGGENGLNN